MRLLAMLGMVSACSLLASCSILPHTSETNSVAMGKESGWQTVILPTKRRTLFAERAEAGRPAIRAVADASASLLRRRHDLPPQNSSVYFSWKTNALIAKADMAERDAEDAVVRLILTFEGDRSKFSAKNRMLSDLSLALTGEELPYATLMYVWCNSRQVGEIITNPRTDRIRKLVVESGTARLGRWLDYERDIRADFIKAFGEEPGALTGIAIMTDTDNTQSKATAWYGPIRFTPVSATSAASPAR